MPNSTTLITLAGGYVRPDEDMPFLDLGTDSWEEKDRKFEAVQPVMSALDGTKRDHTIPEFTPVSNQGAAGSCVANAWCDTLEILTGLEYGEARVEQLSRRFAYWISRYLHSATDRDSGTFPRAMAHQMRHIGVITEEMMPYSDRRSAIIGKKASPLLEHFTQASNNRINSFYRLSSDERQLKEAETAIHADHPVMFAVPVTRDFQNCRNNQLFRAPQHKRNIVGWHAMIITGVRYVGPERHWFVRNSWSRFWGEEGHCWIDDDYFLLSRDTWVGTLKVE